MTALLLLIACLALFIYLLFIWSLFVLSGRISRQEEAQRTDGPLS